MSVHCGRRWRGKSDIEHLPSDIIKPRPAREINGPRKLVRGGGARSILIADNRRTRPARLTWGDFGALPAGRGRAGPNPTRSDGRNKSKGGAPLDGGGPILSGGVWRALSAFSFQLSAFGFHPSAFSFRSRYSRASTAQACIRSPCLRACKFAFCRKPAVALAVTRSSNSAGWPDCATSGFGHPLGRPNLVRRPAAASWASSRLPSAPVLSNTKMEIAFQSSGRAAERAATRTVSQGALGEDEREKPGQLAGCNTWRLK